LKGLDFLPEELEAQKNGGKNAKTAKGMFSKENEYVPFLTNFVMNGAVENYLCDLERKMQTTLAEILEKAWETANNWGIDRDRHEWLEDYCA
jgi:hypothetical protein